MGYFGDLAVSTFIAVDEEGGSEVEMEGVGAKLLPYPLSLILPLSFPCIPFSDEALPGRRRATWRGRRR